MLSIGQSIISSLDVALEFGLNDDERYARPELLENDATARKLFVATIKHCTVC